MLSPKRKFVSKISIVKEIRLENDSSIEEIADIGEVVDDAIHMSEESSLYDATMLHL